jgi:hypothetical protein
MAKTWLKVIKARCFRLMSLYHSKPCMSRRWTAWSWWVSLTEHSRSSFALFVLVLCAGFSLSLPTMPLVAVSGKSSLWVLESMLEPIIGVVCQRRFLPLGRGDYSYDVELYASAKCYASTKCLLWLKLWDIFWSILWSFTPCNSNTCNKCVITFL